MSNPELLAKRCRWRVNRKEFCDGKCHLAKHHRQALEENGVKIDPPRQSAGSRVIAKGKSKGRGKGDRRAVRAVIDGEPKWLLAEDIGNETEELNEVVGGNPDYAPSIAAVTNVDATPLYFYTDEFLDACQAGSELLEAQQVVLQEMFIN